MTSTVGQFAISTTFTPPATCTSAYLTMMERLQWEIWLNYPSPVNGSTVTDCYPTPFISSFLAAEQPLPTSLPAISPLVCPIGYGQILSNSNGYIACCPSNFLLASPTTSIISSRPAYGGTCYSDISIVVVTSYANTSAPPVTSTWSASTQPAQAFALVLEGFAPANATSTGKPIFASSTSSPVSTSQRESKISGGAIAGIVLGCILGVLLIFAAVFFVFIRRRRQHHSINSYPFSASQPNDSEMPTDNGYSEKGISDADDSGVSSLAPNPPPKNNVTEMPVHGQINVTDTKTGTRESESELQDTRDPPMTRFEME